MPHLANALLLAAGAMLAVAGPIVTGGVRGATQTPAPEVLAFEVASIRQSTFPNEYYFEGYLSGGGLCGSRKPAISGNRLHMAGVTLCTMIRFAYDMKDYQIVNMPSWMTRREQSNFFDVDAIMGSDTQATEENSRRMFRSLLRERFQLGFHSDLMEVPVNALTVTRNGPKLTLPANNRCRGPRGFVVGPGLLASCAPELSMLDFAVMLGRETDRTVVDKTGLSGGYAFQLQWNPEGRELDPNLPGLSTAIQEQLGLRLEPQRMPTEVMVIDRAERPTPN